MCMAPKIPATPPPPPPVEAPPPPPAPEQTATAATVGDERKSTPAVKRKGTSALRIGLTSQAVGGAGGGKGLNI